MFVLLMRSIRVLALAMAMLYDAMLYVNVYVLCNCELYTEN